MTMSQTNLNALHAFGIIFGLSIITTLIIIVLFGVMIFLTWRMGKKAQAVYTKTGKFPLLSPCAVSLSVSYALPTLPLLWLVPKTEPRMICVMLAVLILMMLIFVGRMIDISYFRVSTATETESTGG